MGEPHLFSGLVARHTGKAPWLTIATGFLVIIAPRAGLGQQTIFGTEPVWFSGPVNKTKSVSVGDVDVDGDLDLVCGNNGSNTLYLNEGGVFSVTPVWSSIPTNATNSVSLGDVDGDGDLDLVCGNNGSNTLYLNEGGVFSVTPVWSSGPANRTLSVSLGDVDGDGDLDLVCANYYQSNTLYLNEGGVFSVTPVWLSIPTNATNSVSLGDVDGDGDLDLVCGNGEFIGQSNTLYLNEGGVFSVTPVWSSLQANETRSVSLGDVDGDGDLDLVCGNEDQNNTLYLNQGGVFSARPVWSSGPANTTNSVALGDVDGDGNLDFVYGNFGQSNRLYLNQGGVTPVWSSGPANNTQSVALGDVDGDGDLDLACGNIDQSNTLYLNEGAVFSVTPAWLSGPANRTTGISLGDVDGDGDLDLACGNIDQSNTLYPNQGGVFSATPVWSSGPANMTNSVSLRDVDGDGDLDLAYGNGTSTPGQSNTLYESVRFPVYKGDPLGPTNHLPNNGAHLRWVSTEQPDTKVYRVKFTGVDVESDSVWIVPEYQFEGQPVWYPVDTGGPPGKIGPFPSLPAGVRDSLDWDISRIPFDNRDIVLRLRTIEVPKKASLIQHAPGYVNKVGKIVPIRPEIASSVALLDFPTVTVGDTVSMNLSLRNAGAAPLAVNNITLPSVDEMSLDSLPPFAVGIGESIDLVVLVHPVNELNIAGDVVIDSNDPLNPAHAVAVRTDIRGLNIISRLITGPGGVELGDAVTVVVTPNPLDTRIESGILHYAIPGAGGGLFTTPLLASADDFVGVIAGGHVTEAGLEYWVEVWNLPVFTYDPPGAPQDSVFTVVVPPPVTVSSIPQPNSGGGFLEGREIRVLVDVQRGTVLDSARIHYRRGGEGEAAYAITGVDIDVPIPSATIPLGAAGARGVEYWLEAFTLTRRLTDPPIDPGNNPRVIRIDIQNLLEPRVHGGGKYRMVTVPLDFGSDFIGTLEALLSDQESFGPYDPTQWRAFRYIPDLPGYSELPDQNHAAAHYVAPGKGFWLVSRGNNRIDTSPVDGTSTRTSGNYSIALSPGWNQIGNPFVFAVAWDSMRVDTLTMAEAESTVVEPLVRWVVGQGYEYEVDALEPFDGYWVKNLTASDVVLKIPPREVVTSSAPTVTSSGTESEDSWVLGVRAASMGARDHYNYIGVRSGAQKKWDRHDRSEPPMSPGPSLSLYFPHGDWERLPGNYTVDVRGEYEPLDMSKLGVASAGGELWGHIWSFDVAKNSTEEPAGDEVTLEFVGADNVPGDAKIYIIDRDLEKLIDLQRENPHTFFLARRDVVYEEDDTRFILLVGSEAFIAQNELPKLPTKTALYQNYPNPFNPSTIIRFDLAQAVHVNLTVYDVRGKRVITLVDQNKRAGPHEVGWNGRDGRGGQVASGIYFYRLRTNRGYTETRKMVLLK